MRGNSAKTWCVSAVLSVAISGCTAMEHKKMGMTDAPMAVQDGVKRAVGTNKLEDFSKENEDGKTVYEASFEVGGVDHSVTLSEAGDVLEEEADIEVSALPAAVSATVVKTQPLGHVKEAAMVKAGGQSFYEVDTKVGEEKHELRISADGTLIADKVEADEDKDQDNDGDKGKGGNEKDQD